MRLLLARGADPNGGLEEKGHAPLAVAKDAETARLLIAAGAIVDLPDYKNYTPLCHAILKGKKELVKALLDAGADPNWGDGLPLKCCADTCNQEILDLLRDF